VHAGIVLELGHPVAGREEQALELFDEFLAAVAEAISDERLHAFRWLGLEDGDLTRRAAIVVLEGTRGQLDDFASSDEFRELRYAAPSFLQGFSISRARPADEPGADGPSLMSAVLERWRLVRP
jgi:hypothetical protein